MPSTVRLSPPFSIILIEDSAGRGDVPEITRYRGIWATPSCIVVPTLSEMDGETDIALSISGGPLPPSTLAFDGILESPNHSIAVWTAERKKLVESEVNHSRTRVRICVNDPTEPDEIDIILD